LGRYRKLAPQPCARPSSSVATASAPGSGMPSRCEAET
jgi:hypothetical protein